MIRLDNEAMQAMFTLPPPSHMLPLATQDLPPVENVTGDTEVDAFLWLRTVISTGSPNLIAKAMEAKERIKTPPKVLQDRYNNFQQRQSKLTGTMTFIFGFDDLQGLADQAIADADKRHEALKRFGTKEALFSDQPAQVACKRALRGLKSPKDDLESYDEEQADKRFAARIDLAPHTLADCLHARRYWSELYWLRNKSELYGGDMHRSAHEHDWFCLRSLSRIAPRSKEEAQSVLEHIYGGASVNHEDKEPIVRHLVAAGWST